MQKLKSEIRQRICDAALEEFGRCGYAAANIRQVAEKAGVSLGNIYRYFANKETLYLAVTAPFKKNVKDFVSSQCGLVGQSCEDFAKALAKFADGHECEFEIILKDCPYCNGFVDFVTDAAVEKIKSGADTETAQSVRRLKDANRTLVVRGYITSVIEVLRQKEKTKSNRHLALTEITAFYFGH